MNKTSVRMALLLALTGLALLKVGALQICGTGTCRALPADIAVLSALHAIRSPVLDSFFALVTWAGSLFVLLPVALVFALRDQRANNHLQRWFVPLALCFTWIAVQSTKLLVARPRPGLFDALITLPTDGSYPSDHAAQITAFACAWALRSGERARTSVIGLLLATVLSVALSRLYLQVHYPSDVIYGMAASTLWVAALYCLRVAGEARP